MTNLKEVAKQYIDTKKKGDRLRVVPCDNPPGWWSVLRNDRPIHHFSSYSDAWALCCLIVKGSQIVP